MEQTEEKKDKKKTIILVILLVLIVVAVIAILCYKKFYNPELNEIKKIPLSTQIAEYEGENVPGADVKLMLAKILDQESEKPNTSLSKIEYNYKDETEEVIEDFIEIKSDNQYDNIQEIVKLRNLISNEEIYEIEYEKENDAITFISIKIKDRN